MLRIPNRQNPLPPSLYGIFSSENSYPCTVIFSPTFHLCNLPQYCYNWIQYRYTRKGNYGGKNMNFFRRAYRERRCCKKGNVLKSRQLLKPSDGYRTLTRWARSSKRRFANENINKILTIGASGIGIACIAAMHFHVPVVFAKKSQSVNLDGEMYVAEVESFTHKCKKSGHRFQEIPFPRMTMF